MSLDHKFYSLLNCWFSRGFSHLPEVITAAFWTSALVPMWWLLPDNYLQLLLLLLSSCLLDISVCFSQDVSNSTHTNIIILHIFLTLLLLFLEWHSHNHPASHQSQIPRVIQASFPSSLTSVGQEVILMLPLKYLYVVLLSISTPTALIKLSPGLFKQASTWSFCLLVCHPFPRLPSPIAIVIFLKLKWSDLCHMFRNFC